MFFNLRSSGFLQKFFRLFCTAAAEHAKCHCPEAFEKTQKNGVTEEKRLQGNAF
jgi:hypothetical protein